MTGGNRLWNPRVRGLNGRPSRSATASPSKARPGWKREVESCKVIFSDHTQPTRSWSLNSEPELYNTQALH